LIETANPEINVEELMQRARGEAAKLRATNRRSAGASVH
jgi:hypothetical protein